MTGWAMALFQRDLRLSVRIGGSALVGVLFFLAVVTVIPFGVGPDLNLLARIGPAILWIGALLATLLGLDRLFQADREDGTLDLMMMAGRPLELVILIKCLAHWIATGLPLVVAAPLLAIFLNLDPVSMGAVTLTLLVGTPALTLIGAIGASLTVSLRRGGLLLAVLVIPLAIPVLIFGVSSADAAIHDPVPFLTPFLILCALTLIAAVVGPIASAAALRFSAD
ncbi:MAG: heme exporter protein CcmB [Roseibium album]|uniref:Heme exporter protein B n=1 Tax=Roseibium album TaxID=311410 RepID=A0A0M6ZXF5_9HYPH|nr:heme exporter protein CcmB [Roseibium album]MBG6144094.1 heme exporter protein B [Labrenzia sp. EL_142]MBG6157434.1 heme exporter protein B [Labrenzia sp. EL_162]MBG6162864.1 heme exporter protein B [Labrenzia sp. EL_195]MBG6174741.1 heme exporter protein B [Labrenzia sp. EL_132]MBG6196172.1 heme exporter protein B [Labrenzia sp. EL_159]MBG6201600.1 heme exporter protein B [Labrenzia sp. EL_13]MBG6207615.1 heme exporter protein B [Labrenzia sp. EL_126]MBG6228977.1 heme exporter protein B